MSARPFDTSIPDDAREAPGRRKGPVEWRDLVGFSRLEFLRELTLSLPWLAGSLGAAQARLRLLASPRPLVFFLTGLRQVPTRTTARSASRAGRRMRSSHR